MKTSIIGYASTGLIATDLTVVFRLFIIVVVLFAADVVLPSSRAAAQDWPNWRGPDSRGNYAGKSLGVDWSDTSIRWKVRLPSGSNSSPIVCDGTVFVTAAEQNGSRRVLFAFDRSDGSVRWRQSVAFDGTESTHPSNPPCSASPVTDGHVVCASFGSAGAIGCTLEGELLWQIDLGKLEHVFGNASSPIIWKDLCILWCGPGSRQFLLAVDKRTGEEVWRHEVPGGKPDYNVPSDCVGSWSTPVCVNIGGRDQLIVNAPEQLISLDPISGSVHWTCKDIGKLAYASPVLCDENVIVASGFHGPIVAVRATGKGDVTDTHVAWRRDERQPQRIGSPVIFDDQLVIINENGVAEIFDAKTGQIFPESSARVCGQTWSSPVVAGNTFLIASLRGEISVLAADKSFDSLARYQLSERVASSLAVSDGDVFVRGYQHLFCIEP
jgi:outer membrane protein assembly factor BamB